MKRAGGQRGKLQIYLLDIELSCVCYVLNNASMLIELCLLDIEYIANTFTTHMFCDLHAIRANDQYDRCDVSLASLILQ